MARFFLPASQTIRFVAFLAVTLFAVIQGSGSTEAASRQVSGRRAALVIGNSDYATLPRLPNATNDADKIGEVLRDANFEVTVGENLDKKGLEKTVREFLQTLTDGDTALFYYSGHAVQVAGENYILPVDANLSSSYDLEVESYNVGNLLDYMRASSAMQILVLDACRDNPFRNEHYFVGDKKVDVGKTQGLASLAPRQGALIVYSTAPNQVAYDGAGKVSPFAGAFADHVLSPNQEVREVLTKIRTEVIDKTAGRQVPWDVSSLTSQFYFVSRQNMLVLGESVTEVRVSPDATRIELHIEPPISSADADLTAVFDKAPKTGILLLDDKTLTAGAPFDAKRLGDVILLTDAGQKAVELIPYTVKSEAGQAASGAVAVVFDPTVTGPRQDTPLVVASADDGSVTKAMPVSLTLKPDVGTGFAPVPKIELGGKAKGWLRLKARDPNTQVALDGKMLMLGDLVKTEDLPRMAIRPAIHQTEKPAQILLQPAVATSDVKAVVISVDAEVNLCDTLAAEPLDTQGVTDGVFPNDIRIPEATEACRQAVADFPDVPRFKFEYGRVLFASGKFDGALKMMQEALAGGHMRAGQFLGRLYQLGSGVPLDPKKAVPLFEAAAKKGDPYAQYSLGRALMDGNGVTADVKAGIALLNKAVESGHTYALNQLGAEYLYGNRVEKDVERAHVMFEKSAARGDVWGEVNLGILYRDGIAVPHDAARAHELFEHANDKLHPYAARLMALMDRQAGNASPSDLLKLFRESASRGDGWGAFYAAELISADPSLAQDQDEVLHLYGLAAARKAGRASDDAKARLGKAKPAEIAQQIQKSLQRMGAADIQISGKLSKRDRSAAAAVLGGKSPSDPVDLFVALSRQEWVNSTPRLDML